MFLPIGNKCEILVHVKELLYFALYYYFLSMVCTAIFPHSIMYCIMEIYLMFHPYVHPCLLATGRRDPGSDVCH